ncbi:MAG: hypothetical protein ACPG5B_07300 [Chitinophagales bacterium]
MYKTKLIILLKSLHKKELKKFEYYINTPFFNTKKACIKLFNILSVSYPDFAEKEVARTVIFSKMFSQKKFQYNKLRYVMSDLTKLLEDFLAYCEYEKNASEVNPFLLKAYASKNINNHFEQTFAQQQKTLEEILLRDDAFFFQQFTIEKERYNFNTLHDNHTKFDVESILSQLDNFYIINKLKFYCEILNNPTVVSVHYEMPSLIEEILNYIEQQEAALSPAIMVYYQIVKTLQDHDNENNYEVLLAYLQTYRHAFSDVELNHIYIYIKNYCVKKINNGNKVYFKKLHDMYKLLLKEEIILYRNYLSEFDYKNIVTLGLGLKEFDYTKVFIEEYKKHLLPEVSKNAYTFNLAHFYFHTKNFQEVLSLLNEVVFTDSVYALDTKVLMAKSFYELNEVGLLWGFLDTFSAYLRKSKNISDTQRILYKRFISYLKKMTRINSLKEINKLREKIKDKPCGDSSWLLKKLNELE